MGTSRVAYSVCVLAAAALLLALLQPASASPQASFTITVTAIEPSVFVAPENGVTTGLLPTIYGDAHLPNTEIVITGLSGGTTTVVATATSDSSGMFVATVGSSTPLDTGSNTLLSYIFGQPGNPYTITVVSEPTTVQVPTIAPQFHGTRFSVTRPLISGSGDAGSTCTLYSKHPDGQIYEMGSASVDGDGRFAITPQSDFPSGTCEVFVVVSGSASSIAEIEFVDPYGVVHDSQTNAPVEGAEVRLQRSLDGGASWNNAVPGVDIQASDANPQTTDVTGMFSFLAVPGDYRFVVAKNGYTFPSAIVPMGQPAVGSHGELFTVTNEVLHISLPVDFHGEGLLKISKSANKREASIGDIVTYTVTIENDGADSVTNVYVKDRIPGGFKYIRGRTLLDGQTAQEPSGTRELIFDIGTLTAGQTRVLRYQLVIGSGVTFGDYRNVASCVFSNGREISNAAQASVRVVVDPTFDLGTIMGKVYRDANTNGRQDPGEKPIPAIRIIMEDGTIITTDADGKFHVPGVLPGRHVLMVDERSLPQGASLTTRKAVLVDVTAGMPAKANFGIMLNEAAMEGALTERPLIVHQDSQRPSPRLNLAFYDMAQGNQKYDAARRYVFRIFTNYAAFIDTWRIAVIDADTKAVLHEFAGTRNDIYSPIYWDGTIRTGTRIDKNREYACVLTVRSATGAEDTTAERLLELKTREEDIAEAKDRIIRGERIGSTKVSLDEWLAAESSHNNIERQCINVDGETLHLQASNTGASVIQVRSETGLIAEVPANRALSIRTGEVDDATDLLPTRAENVSTDLILPRGHYDIEVIPVTHVGSASGATGANVSASGDAEAVSHAAEPNAAAIYSEHVSVCEDYMTLVAMGDAKIGYAFHSGSIEPVASRDGYKTGLWHDGKIAYYLKGRIKGKYLITSSFDSDRDKKELFRKIEPQKYYPVYGDSSSVNFDATNTQGRLYLLLEWDKSSAVWGSYETGFDDAELAAFSRTLYGGKLDYQSVEGTKFGEPVTRIKAFTAEAHQRAAHNEFVGTGGSLYYLKDRDVIEGSEKVTIEVRDNLTGLTLTSRSMSEGSDYHINYKQGRILFWRPVSSVVESDNIISTALLGGSRVYVVVDYEYETTDRLGNDTAGITGMQAVGDHLMVGGTYVKEQQLDKDYELKAASTRLHLTDTAVIKGEYAESHDRGTGSWVSTDGGLTFAELPTARSDNGKAYSASFEDHLWNSLGITAYYRRIEDGFSSTSTSSQQGKEALGAELTYDITGTTRFKLRHDEQELIGGGNPQTRLQIGADKTATTSAQVIHTMEDLRLTGEYRRQRVSGRISPFASETNQQGDIVAARADYMLEEKTEVSLEQQFSVSGSANNQTTAGVVTRLTDNLDLRATQTIGNRGSATSLGAVARNGDKYELYTDYTLSDYGMGNAASIGGRMKQGDNVDTYTALTAGSGGRTSSIVGTRTRAANGTEISQERSITSTSAETGTTDIVGASSTLSSNWRALAQIERGDVQKHDGSVVKRSSNAFGLGYVETDPATGRDLLRTLTKFELRSDTGDTHERQYLLYNSLEARPDSDLVLSAALELSQTKDIRARRTAARYTELVLGIAFRPVDWDDLNFIGKYTYLSDDGPSSQRDIADIDSERSHTIAGEMIYDLTDRWQLTTKLAFKMGDEKVSGFDWTRTQRLLFAQRASYMFHDNWRIAVEYRRLAVLQAHDVTQGALVEISRSIGDYLDLGIGYNFTHFNDDLTRLNYTSQGPYIRLTAVFFN